MFNAGRILRNLNRNDPNSRPATSALISQPKKQKKKFRCYVPFVWQALMTTCIGFLVILVGVGLCVIGYYADHIRSLTVTNSSLTSPAVAKEPEGREAGAKLDGDGGGYNYLRCMVYFGPALMSCGSFAIVFSCVVVCETRDKLLEFMDEHEKSILSHKDNRKFDFFQSVVGPTTSDRSPNRMDVEASSFHEQAEGRGPAQTRLTSDSPDAKQKWRLHEYEIDAQLESNRLQTNTCRFSMSSNSNIDCIESDEDLLPLHTDLNWKRDEEIEPPTDQSFSNHIQGAAAAPPVAAADCLPFVIAAPVDRTLGVRSPWGAQCGGCIQPMVSGMDGDERLLDGFLSCNWTRDSEGRTEGHVYDPGVLHHPPSPCRSVGWGPHPGITATPALQPPNDCDYRLQVAHPTANDDVIESRPKRICTQQRHSITEGLLPTGESFRPEARLHGAPEARLDGRPEVGFLWQTRNDFPDGRVTVPANWKTCTNNDSVSSLPSISGGMGDQRLLLEIPRRLVIHKVHVHEEPGTKTESTTIPPRPGVTTTT